MIDYRKNEEIEKLSKKDKRSGGESSYLEFSPLNSSIEIPKIGGVYFAIMVLLSIISLYKPLLSNSFLTIASIFVFLPLLIKSSHSPMPILLGLIVYIPYSIMVPGNVFTGLNFTSLLLLIAFISIMTVNRDSFDQINFIDNFEGHVRRLVLLFCFLGAFAVLHSDLVSGMDFFSSLIDYKRWVDSFLIFFIFSYLVQKEEDAKTIIYLMGVNLILIGTWSFYHQYDLSQGNHEIRFDGITMQSNQMGSYYANYFCFLLGIFFIYGKGFLKKLFFGIGAFGILVGLFITQSRGAVLALAGSILVFFLLKNKKSFILIVGIIVFLTLNIQYLPRGISERFQHTVVNQSDGLTSGGEYEASAQTRILLWKGAMRMIIDHPILGVGYGMFNTYSYQYSHGSEIDASAVMNRDPHNGYLKIATEMGIPTFVVFIYLLFTMFKISIKGFIESPTLFWKIMSIAGACEITSLVISNMFGSRFISMVLTGYIWALMAILLKIPRWNIGSNEKISL